MRNHTSKTTAMRQRREFGGWVIQFADHDFTWTDESNDVLEFLQTWFPEQPDGTLRSIVDAPIFSRDRAPMVTRPLVDRLLQGSMR